LVDNRPGAGRVVGALAGATAAPDGHALTTTGRLDTIAHGIYHEVPFDIVDDSGHIVPVGGGPQWLVVDGRGGIDSWADLVARARRQPGKVG